MAGKKLQSAKKKKMINNTIVHIVLAVLAVIWLFPIAWVILTSFRAEKGSYVSTFFPKAFTLDNYIKLFTDTSILNFPQMFMNTLFIAICSCILSAFYVLAVSYCLSRLKFKMRKPYMNMAMILGLFPGFMSMIAVYFILKAMGLTEGSLIKLALILCYSGGAGLGFQIAKGFFDTIPVAIDEAALLDGCTRWQIFSKITLPLSKPIIVYTVLTSFMAPWLDFIFAKVICRANSDQYTIAIGLWKMLEKEYIDSWYTSFAAGAVLISIPIAILFLFMQRYYHLKSFLSNPNLLLTGSFYFLFHNCNLNIYIFLKLFPLIFMFYKIFRAVLSCHIIMTNHLLTGKSKSLTKPSN